MQWKCCSRLNSTKQSICSFVCILNGIWKLVIASSENNFDVTIDHMSINALSYSSSCSDHTESRRWHLVFIKWNLSPFYIDVQRTYICVCVSWLNVYIRRQSTHFPSISSIKQRCFSFRINLMCFYDSVNLFECI